ncbi:MAG: class I SAM-dependent methyltransferase [Cyanobacteria bacterium]|nr:class I SAM-dependent methyltransferase [Cyanobacteriota bacterium]
MPNPISRTAYYTLGVRAADAAGPRPILGVRLQGGQWFEFDEPEILNYKESRLPAAEAPNPLRRIPIEFAREKLAGKLTAVTPSSSVHIVIEGVLMYLTREQRVELLHTLADRFPHHTLYCDLMRKWH